MEDTKEQLSREYSEWWREYEKNREKVSAVQKRWYAIQGGGTTSEWIDLFTEAETVLKDDERILAKLQEINNKLKELAQ